MLMRRLHVSNFPSVLLSVIFLLNISTCTNLGNSATQEALQKTVTAVPTPGITSTALPSTSTVPVPTTINKTCWKTEPLKDSNHQFKGSLLYFDPDQKKHILLNLNSYATQETNISGYVSPEGDALVRLDASRDTLEYITQESDVTFKMPTGFYFDGLYGFLPHGNIKLNDVNASASNYKEDVGATDRFYVLDPITGIFTLHEVFLPYYNSRIRDSFLYTIYSPNLKYVIYPAWRQNTIKGILLDIENQKIIWSGDTSSVIYYPPASWLPDSSSAMIRSTQNFFKLLVNGQTIQITYFDAASNYIMMHPVWSPDGRYLTFGDSYGDDNSLMVLDTKTNTIFDTCLSLGTLILPLDWASDSQSFAIMPSDMTSIVIVDLVNGVIYKAYKQAGVDFVDPYAKPNQNLLWLSGWLSWGNS